MQNNINHHRIFVGKQHIDFRKGIDGIVAICKRQYQLDPSKAHYFIFRNRKCTALKILFYDLNGYWLCHKRLSQGKFNNWPTGDDASRELSQMQLRLLIRNQIDRQLT